MIRTAIDTSILMDVFAADPAFGEASLAAVQASLDDGVLVACDVVWAEIRPRFASDDQLLLATGKIELGFEALNLDAALRAGLIWKKYRKRGGKKERMVPDFLIGAHALVQADRLLTRDRSFYRDYFPKLSLREP